MEIIDFLSQNLVLIGFAIVALILAVAIIKKVTGCLVKAVLVALLLAAVVFAYFNLSPTHSDFDDNPDAIIMSDD